MSERVMIACFGMAGGGSAGDLEGAFLASYEPEGNDGHGAAACTADPDLALTFADAGEARKFRGRVPANRPVRPDGQPNRPLTIFAVELVPVPDLAQEAKPGREGGAQMDGMSGEARRILAEILAREDPSQWQHGLWTARETTAGDQAALTGLDRFIGYPGGGRGALWLDGWDQRSIWGYDRQDDRYFAQLWANRPGDSPDRPDIWINGRDTVNGRDYVVSTTHMLAREIAEATGQGLSKVCTALVTSPLH